MTKDPMPPQSGNLENIKGKSTGWWAPSNIALVKYWGKKEGIQLPANASVSLTLSKAKTRVRLEVKESQEQENWLELLFFGKPMPAFLPKLEKYFELASEHLPFLKEKKFLLRSENTFPHSAGIASSASSMAAIALNLVELEEAYTGREFSEEERYLRASFFARLGSGSACRSLYPGGASWGEVPHASIDTSDLYASPIKLHPLYQSMQDTILIVSAREKKVSSRAGHGLMNEHLYGQSRYHQAQANWQHAIEWLQDGSWDHLGSLVEEEALSLHAMMMTSRPGFILMEPDTIEIIQKVREFRFTTGTPVYFTLDAGPNLHLLYPESEISAVEEFLNTEIKVGKRSELSVIKDHVGNGPHRCSSDDQIGVDPQSMSAAREEI